MSLAQDLDFKGKRVLVTGAANGFGAAIATEFAAHGATLVLADIEDEPLRAIAKKLGAEAFHLYDQSNLDSVARLAEAAGEIDILINNAGILIAKPLLETTVEDIQKLVGIDLVGAFRLMQLIGKGMVARKRGVVLSISSQTAFCGGENRGVYAAMKAAISQLTRAAAVEWGPHGVRTLCLAPGRSQTRMINQTVANPNYTGDRGLGRVPLGRWGEPEEMAKMVVFLTSDAAAYVTGETVIADGGYVLG
ncbi:MAG: SDR family oxidoreductase [Rhizobiales bacterium]|nr:SDR family oxidoreductase [Hyphomicrobiales bacterium]